MKPDRLAFVHPPLVSSFFLLFLVAWNPEETLALGGREILVLLTIILAGSGVAVAILARLLGDPKKAGLTASVGAVLFLTYGHLYDGLWALGVPVRSLYLLPAVLALFLGAAAGLRRLDARALERATLAATAMAAILVLPPAAGIALWLTGAGEAVRHAPSTEDTGGDGSLPDIYWIVLDGHARTDILRDYYGHDASDFTRFLEDRGFFVAERSRANYPFTAYSLAATLNMRYLNDPDDPGRVARFGRRGVRGTFEDNEVVRRLRARGYSYGTTATLHGFADRFQDPDFTYPCGRINHIYETFLATTALRSLVRDLVMDDLRQRLLCQFEVLERVKTLDGPTFFMLHILAPHAPYLFDADGAPARLTRAEEQVPNQWYLEDRYVDYTIFLQRKLREAVTSLLDDDDPPIIVLQSDHGPASSTGPPTGPWTPDNTDLLRERMAVLNALHLPGADTTGLRHDMTLVNTWRAVFRRYFDPSTTLLPDRVYFGEYGSHELVDVTGASRRSRGG